MYVFAVASVPSNVQPPSSQPQRRAVRDSHIRRTVSYRSYPATFHSPTLLFNQQPLSIYARKIIFVTIVSCRCAVQIFSRVLYFSFSSVAKNIAPDVRAHILSSTAHLGFLSWQFGAGQSPTLHFRASDYTSTTKAYIARLSVLISCKDMKLSFKTLPSSVINFCFYYITDHNFVPTTCLHFFHTIKFQTFVHRLRIRPTQTSSLQQAISSY